MHYKASSGITLWCIILAQRGMAQLVHFSQFTFVGVGLTRVFKGSFSPHEPKNIRRTPSEMGCFRNYTPLFHAAELNRSKAVI